ncbi:selenocysteine lyase [Candidatus Woesearchaeota archaeon]|nr:selenocysteine lyase [Candidatus Woesearchaeota archaeon]
MNKNIRDEFPFLQKKIKGMDPVYLDSACMSLRPQPVIDAVNSYYQEFPGCGGRSMHKVGRRVDEEVIKARLSMKKFLGAKSEKEIIFTKNTTEAINLVANSLSLSKTVLTTDKEHNSNLVPWQLLSKRKGVTHKIIPSKDDNTFDLEAFEEMMSPDVELVSVVHTSNLDGVTYPLKEICKIAHDHGALVMADAAQSVPSMELDVRKLDVDLLACSGHKMCGPSGTGILYGKEAVLEKLSPFLVGGDTVHETTYTDHEFDDLPERFEAGLQNYAGIIGLGAAACFLEGVGKSNILSHEQNLNKRISAQIEDDVKIIGPRAEERSGIISFVPKGDVHQVALLLDETSNIMVRSGAHCVHSWFNARKIDGSVRASCYLYTTAEEADFFAEKLKEVIQLVK